MRHVSGFPVDVPAMAVISNICRASQGIRAGMEGGVLREHGLTWASFSTLYIVWIWGPIETRAIARSQGVSRPTISSTVDTLERRGLVRRRRDEDDRRLMTVELTPAGRRSIETVYPAFNCRETELVAGLSCDEQEMLARLLRVVISSAVGDATDGESVARNGRGHVGLGAHARTA